MIPENREPHPTEGWTTIAEGKPEPGGIYEVRRQGVKPFFAEVCYGLHEPWWCPTLAGPEAHFTMDGEDRWREYGPEAPAGAAPEAPDRVWLYSEAQTVGLGVSTKAIPHGVEYRRAAPEPYGYRNPGEEKT
jgi:hypothetical protein